MKIIVQVPRKLFTYKSRFIRVIERSTTKIEDTGLRGIQNSIRKRWFRTGNSLNKVTVSVKSDEKSANIIFVSGTNYDQFGEYGTGSRGAASKPKFVPNSWKYGNSILGMKSRFMFHEGIEEVLPEIREDFIKEIKKAL